MFLRKRSQAVRPGTVDAEVAGVVTAASSCTVGVEGSIGATGVARMGSGVWRAVALERCSSCGGDIGDGRAGATSAVVDDCL